MNLMPHWSLTGKNPAFYDTESATAIEQTAKVYGAMQTLITEYNAFVDEYNKSIVDFESSTEKNIDEFKTCITELISNYIHSVDMQIDGVKNYIVDNIRQTTQELLDEAIRLGELKIVDIYNEENENLTLVVAWEV